jgi:hypothetical protein
MVLFVSPLIEHCLLCAKRKNLEFGKFVAETEKHIELHNEDLEVYINIDRNCLGVWFLMCGFFDVITGQTH